MSEPAAEETVTGRCLCGGVRYQLETAKREVDVCHCGMCRRWSSGPFIAFGHEGTIAFEGAENVGVYKSSEWAERAFCKVCGSPLYYHLLGSGFYALSAGTLDDQSRLTLSQQIFIDEKPPYYDFANDTPRLTGAEFIAAFEAAKAAEKDPNG